MLQNNIDDGNLLLKSKVLQNKLQLNINILYAKNLFFNNNIFHVQETQENNNS